jgi:AhpD family alkylhydroperoxidase
VTSRAGVGSLSTPPVAMGVREETRMAIDKSYPDIQTHIQKLMGELRREIPTVMEGFGKLHHAAVGDGALDPKAKELISLGIAISVRCEGCIAFHVHDAVKAGATRAEIVEAIGVAILMGGGPSLMYGVEAYEALGQFEAHLDGQQAPGRSDTLSAD